MHCSAVTRLRHRIRPGPDRWQRIWTSRKSRGSLLPNQQPRPPPYLKTFFDPPYCRRAHRLRSGGPTVFRTSAAERSWGRLSIRRRPATTLPGARRTLSHLLHYLCQPPRAILRLSRVRPNLPSPTATMGRTANSSAATVYRQVRACPDMGRHRQCFQGSNCRLQPRPRKKLQLPTPACNANVRQPAGRRKPETATRQWR